MLCTWDMNLSLVYEDVVGNYLRKSIIKIVIRLRLIPAHIIAFGSSVKLFLIDLNIDGHLPTHCTANLPFTG